MSPTASGTPFVQLPEVSQLPLVPEVSVWVTTAAGKLAAAKKSPAPKATDLDLPLETDRWGVMGYGLYFAQPGRGPPDFAGSDTKDHRTTHHTQQGRHAGL